MASQLAQLVTAVAARVNDATILFETGKLQINRNNQRRKAIFTRPSGILKPSAAPRRAPFGTPVSGVGTMEYVRFTREEQIEVQLSAENEDALDLLFDAVVNAIFDVGGPNVLVQEEQPYQWAGEDSENAGNHVARTPVMTFFFRMRVPSHPHTNPFAQLVGLTSSLTELNQTVLIGFSPEQIPTVAAGYFWDPAEASGSSTAGFLLPEGNLKTAYNLVTPAANTAPALGAINAQAIVTYTNGVPDHIVRTAANVQRGFTGATMFWGWITNASAAGAVLAHGRGAGLVFYIQQTAGSVRVGLHDGVIGSESQFPVPPGGYAAAPFYYEAVFDPSQAAASRIQLTYDRVAQTPLVAATPGPAMQDALDEITFGAGSASDSSTANITADWGHGVVGLTNGIPSTAERNVLFNYKRLK